MSFPAWLTFQQFKARAAIPPGDVDAAAGLYWQKYSPDATALDTVAETVTGQILEDATVNLCQLIPRAALVPDATNHATLTIAKRTGGGAPVTIAQLVTSVTAWAAGIPLAVPILAGAVSAGDIITAQITKQGTGVVVPAFELDVAGSPNFVERKIAMYQAQCEARLRKRYDIEAIATNPPELVRQWVTDMVVPDVYAKRGRNPADPQITAAVDAANAAKAQVLEAANSETGLFELPLVDGAVPDVDGVVKAGPLSYAEQSPYTFADNQACAGRNEDAQGVSSS